MMKCLDGGAWNFVRTISDPQNVDNPLVIVEEWVGIGIGTMFMILCRKMYWNLNYQVVEYTGISEVYSTGKVKMYWKMYWNVLEFHFLFLFGRPASASVSVLERKPRG